MASNPGGKVGAIFGDDDYLSLEKLLVRLEKESLNDDGTFTLCFWVYLLKSSKAGVLIRQGPSEAGSGVPFLTIEADRKLTLHPLPPPLECGASVREDAIVVVADQPCAMEKWVHIGCEIGPDIARLHLNGGVVGERRVDSSYGNEDFGGDSSTILLSGGDGSSDGNSVQGYAHYVRVLPQPTVTNHYVKNPPLELSLDGSTGASDDHEVEEGGDGVWSVVGGKASCRRNFALDVALLDALGRSIHKEMELVALLVYADSGSPVEKPKDDAEAPLLTTFDGVEFPSTERPIKLIHGRASFKLKISQLSSKCDNRLFRVCFDSPSIPHYPFLRAFSRPIRCVSRNRNHRTPAGAWKQKPSNPLFPLDGTVSPGGKEMISGETHLGNSDAHSNGTVPTVVGVHVSPFLPGQPPLKRTRYQEKVPNGAVYIETATDRMGVPNGELKTPFSGTFQRPILPTSPLGSFGWPVYAHLPLNGPVYKSPTLDSNGSLDTMNKQDVIKDGNSLDCGVTEIASNPKSSAGGFSDLLVFKYCLENMACRAAFLKAAIMVRNDLDLADFAGRVSHCSGCRHNGFQILMSKKLLHDGNEMWKNLSADSHPVSWSILVKHIEESFMKISGCNRRSFSSKDQEFLHQIANCGEYISREEFDRLWQWIYPTAVALSSPQLQSTWESENPKWIEGMISRDEAETLLKAHKDMSMPGTFLLRFANSRIWPHPDAGALVVSYVGNDRRIYHKLLTLDVESGTGFVVGENASKPLSEMLLSQPELSQLCRVSSSQPEQTTADLKEEPLSSGGVDAPI